MTAETTFTPLLSEFLNDDVSLCYAVVNFFRSLFIVGFWLTIILLLVCLIHFCLTLPMRRAERARLFIDLVENILKKGQSIENAILSIAQSCDLSLGVRFHLLAANLEGGLKLGEALEKVPRFLPPQIFNIILAGEKLGDLKSVLPACREILRDRPVGVRSSIHYMLLVILFFSPGAIFIMVTTTVFVIPRFKEVAQGMGTQLGPLAQFVFFGSNFWLIGFEIIYTILLVAVTLIYIGGPRFTHWFQFRQLPIVDWIAWHVPWKQKRLQRTFSAMLAVLLDGGVPEAEAVRLAGDSTANEICRRRCQHIIRSLEKGVKLDEAVHAFDDHGEFHWRLTNANHAHGGFLEALRGWHEALDARAFQQEEATAHVVTSGLVILNGLVVALIAVAMFGVLVATINGMLSSL
jgi:type IV pilus assembly protein PilC